MREEARSSFASRPVFAQLRSVPARVQPTLEDAVRVFARVAARTRPFAELGTRRASVVEPARVSATRLLARVRVRTLRPVVRARARTPTHFELEHAEIVAQTRLDVRLRRVRRKTRDGARASGAQGIPVEDAARGGAGTGMRRERVSPLAQVQRVRPRRGDLNRSGSRYRRETGETGDVGVLRERRKPETPRAPGPRPAETGGALSGPPGAPRASRAPRAAPHRPRLVRAVLAARGGRPGGSRGRRRLPARAAPRERRARVELRVELRVLVGVLARVLFLARFFAVVLRAVHRQHVRGFAPEPVEGFAVRAEPQERRDAFDAHRASPARRAV